MIGIFDSGLGGIQTLNYIQKQLPDYDYVFLADNAHVPYGDKTPEQIQTYTFQALNRLFDHGCTLVIIACNTAAAYSIRKRQSQHPEKKALSVTIPGIETIAGNHNQNLTLLATQATIDSGIYEDLLARHNFTGNITNIAANDLVTAIENPNSTTTTIENIITKHFSRTNTNDTLILGCTHFPIVHDIIARHRTGPIIDPGLDTATKLADYLTKHSEIEKTLSRHGTTNHYTTGSASDFEKKIAHIYGQSLSVKHINI